MDIAVSLFFMLILVLLSGTFSGSETVLFSLSSVQLERDAASPNPFRRFAAQLMERPRSTLMTILVGNTAVNVLVFANSYILFGNLAAQFGAWINPLAGVASVLVVVVCGEVVPKVLGVTLADRLSPFSATVVRFSGYVLGPLGRVLEMVVVEPLTRLIFGRPGHAPSSQGRLTIDELKALLELNRRRGVIDRVEDLYLREVIDLSELRVRDIMVPRVEVQMFDVNGAPDDLRELMRRTRMTKVPVYDGAIDNVVGMVYAKILFFRPDTPLRELVSPVRFVPELASAENLLLQLRRTRSQIAVAVDEHGGMAGIVTLEDVVEEIVGDICDPEDTPFDAEIRAIGEDQFEVPGRLNVQDWVEYFGPSDHAERVTTLGGLVMARLGRPAVVGDVATIGNVEFRVTAVNRRRIDRLHVQLVREPTADGPDGPADTRGGGAPP